MPHFDRRGRGSDSSGCLSRVDRDSTIHECAYSNIANATLFRLQRRARNARRGALVPRCSCTTTTPDEGDLPRVRKAKRSIVRRSSPSGSHFHTTEAAGPPHFERGRLEVRRDHAVIRTAVHHPATAGLGPLRTREATPVAGSHINSRTATIKLKMPM